MKILITGGAGYLGCILSKKLLDKGCYVKVIDNLLYNANSIKHLLNNKHFCFIKGGVHHLNDLVVAFEDVDHVVDLAAIVGDPACLINRNAALITNYVSTFSQFEISKMFKIKKFVFASTCSVYGSSKNADKIDEDTPANPLSLYAKTKLDSEKILLNNFREEYPKAIVLRLATLFGASHRMRFDLVANIMIANAVKKNVIYVNGGKQMRPILHVEDAADCFLKVLEAPENIVENQIFNVGTNEQNYTINELALRVQNIHGSCKIEGKPFSEDIRSYKVDFSKIENAFNFKANKTLENAYYEIKYLIKNGIIKNIYSSKYHNIKCN